MSSKYQFGQRIGAGGMADVYKGFDTSLQRSVAIKVMKANMVENPRFVERFGREARVNARLRHQNIVQVYDLGETEGCPMLVMELLEGETLKDRIHRGPLSEAEAVNITRQVLQALAFAQEQEKVVHRDIKPGNVFLSHGWDEPDAPDGLVKLMDFGIASAAAEMQVTVGGERFGTPDYMSPEQASGTPTSFPTDTYAVGVMLYEMLSGTTPFRADNPLVVMSMHVSAPPPPLPPTVSPHLRNVVMTALEKDPAARYPNARAMGAALLGRNSGSWPSAGEPASNRPPTGNFPTPTNPTNPTPKAGPNYIAIGGATVCVAALGGIAVMLFGGSKPAPAASPTPGVAASPKAVAASPKPSPSVVAVAAPKPSPRPTTEARVAAKPTPASTPAVAPRPASTPEARRVTRRPFAVRTPRPDRPTRRVSDEGVRERPSRTRPEGRPAGKPASKLANKPGSLNDLAPD
jgi:eukaryotic-like serine/threonine-protein kinase